MIQIITLTIILNLIIAIIGIMVITIIIRMALIIYENKESNDNNSN